MNAALHTGLVRWFKPELGFGFIAIPPNLKRELGLPADKDLFFHVSSLPGHPKPDLQPGDQITFEVQLGSRGPRAIRVQLLARPAPEPLENVRD